MAEAVAPQVFTRRASGLVRVMSPYSAFIYNILTMGVIFPWTYLWAPTAFQGSNLVLGILFAFLFELPIALAYAWLATALPIQTAPRVSRVTARKITPASPDQKSVM